MKLIFLCLMFFGFNFNAFATGDDFEVLETEYFYQPQKGENYLFINTAYIYSDLKIKDSDDLSFSKTQLELQYEYALTNKTSLNLSNSFQSEVASSGSTKTKSNGIGDSQLTLKHRHKTKPDESIHYALAYRIGLQQRTKDGLEFNAVSGGQELTAGLGYQWYHYDFIMGLDINWSLWASDRETKENSSISKERGGDTFSLRSFYLNQIEKGSYGAIFEYRLDAETEAIANNGSISGNNDSREYLSFGGVLNFQLTSKYFFVGEFLYHQLLNTTYMANEINSSADYSLLLGVETIF